MSVHTQCARVNFSVYHSDAIFIVKTARRWLSILSWEFTHLKFHCSNIHIANYKTAVINHIRMSSAIMNLLTHRWDLSEGKVHQRTLINAECE